ncbi:MAG: ArsR/SmtB family transcription factor [Aggregatilineales bacterium]
MQDVFYIEDLNQAVSLLKPQRLEILKRMDEPRSCPELAGYFDSSAQKIYYHVKALEKSELVARVDEKRVRGIMEGYYQARARSYWLAPKLVGQIGGEQLNRDRLSLSVLLDMAADIHEDVGKLGNKSADGVHIPSLSMSAQIHLPDGKRRAAFLQELQEMFQQLARKYSLPEDDIAITDEQGFRLVLMCYPKEEQSND